MIIIGGLSAGAAAAVVRASVAAALEVINVKRPQARSVTASLCHPGAAFSSVVSKVTTARFLRS